MIPPVPQRPLVKKHSKRAAAFGVAVLTVLAALPARAVSPYVRAFSSYLGGSGWEHARDIFADSSGNVYVVGGTGPNGGTTGTNNFPTTSGAYSSTHISPTQPNGYNKGVSTGTGVGNFGTCDAFVAKFNASGQLLWSTFVGGPGYDRAYAVEVDATGCVYISGRAGPGFPTTAGALQPAFAGTTGGSGNYGHQNGFVAKLSADGSQLLWATYLGTGELVRDFDIDNDGDVYALLTQATASSNTLPAAFTGAFANAFRPTAAPGSNTECGAVKIKGDGSQVLWATWLGGSGEDSTAGSLRVNRTTKCPVVLFYTTSTNVVTAGSGATTTNAGLTDMFVAALNSTGSALLFATYLGGSGTDQIETHGLALDAAGDVYIAVNTQSPNFPTTPGTVGTVLQGNSDIGIAKIGTDGRVIASTLVGGSGSENPDGIYVDSQGRIVVVAESNSTNFPITSATAFQTTGGGSYDAVLFVLSADFRAIEYGTYLGGTLYDNGRTCFLGGDGAIYFAGGTLSTNFPTQHAHQSTFGGGGHPFAPGSGDCIVGKFCRTTDSDGDSRIDIDEFAAATNTLDPGDFFRVDQVTQDGNGLHHSLPGRKGRYYILESTTDFITWTEVTRTSTLTAAQSRLLSDPNPASPFSFCRVRVVFP